MPGPAWGASGSPAARRVPVHDARPSRIWPVHAPDLVLVEVYPYLQDYYEAFVEEWLSERGLLEDPAGSGDDSASGREAC